jgi:hypothetical protein
VTRALIDTVPTALGIMLSPLPLVQFILVLLSERARSNGLVFLAGLVVLMFATTWGAAVLLETTSTGTTSTSDVRGWVFLVLAALLLAVAVRTLRDRSEPTTPRIYDRIGGMGPWAVLALTPTATVVNPKNLLLLTGAGTTLGSADLSSGATVLACVLFALLAASPYIVAVVYLALAGDTGAAQLERGKEWLVRHNRTITAALAGVIALVLLVRGLAILVG